MASQKAILVQVSNAKDALKDMYSAKVWFRGVGIVPAESGLGLRLNVDPVEVVDEELPTSFHGFDVEVIYTGGYKPRTSKE